MKSILDPSFRYTPAAKTDISKTFRRVRQELKGQMGISPLRTVPVMYGNLPNGMTDDELAECQEILRQDYENLGDPWNPEVHHA